MPNIRQYRYFHRGDNDWLSSPDHTDDPEWQRAWDELKAELKKSGHEDIQIEFSEDMYNNQEYGETPDWVNITIHDSGVLPFKMARGLIGALDGARSITFGSHFDVEMDSGWGGFSFTRLEVYQGGAYITVGAKHSNEELEINITEQFNQAIGEEK